MRRRVSHFPNPAIAIALHPVRLVAFIWIRGAGTRTCLWSAGTEPPPAFLTRLLSVAVVGPCLTTYTETSLCLLTIRAELAELIIVGSLCCNLSIRRHLSSGIGNGAKDSKNKMQLHLGEELEIVVKLMELR